jgi:hypothetical protein
LARPEEAGDRDVLGLARGAVLGRDVHDAVGIDVEGDLDLGHAARRGRDAHELELPQRAVVARHRALALEDVHLDRRLAVGGGGEHLRLARGDGRVALDQAREDAAQGLDAEGKRSHVQEQQVLDVARQHAGLDGGAHRDHLVRVHALVRLLAEEVLDELLDLRDARRSADEDDLVDLVRRHARVLQALAHGRHRALQEVPHELLELRAAQLQVQVLGAGGVGGDEGKVDLRLRGGGELHLGLLRRFLEPLEGHLVLAEVDALVLLELADDPLDDALVQVVAAEMGVPVRGLDLDHALADLQDGDVEGPAAEVVDRDRLVLLLVEAVGQRGRVGSFTMRRTSRPAMRPASLVAWRCESLK